MKRFNYTGRKKILKQDIRIRLHGDFNEPPVVDFQVDLEGYDFQLDAEVFLEAWDVTRFMRFKVGKVSGSIRKNNIELYDFDDAENLSFNIKVVDINSGGVLLGIAEKVMPNDKDNLPDKNYKSILPVASTDLSSYGVLWRVEWHDENAVLQVESELGNREQVVRSNIFRAFIYPAAMRQILMKILSDGWDDQLEDPDDLSTRWLRFAEQLGAERPVPDSDNEEWLDTAIRLFMNKMDIREKIIDEFSEGGWN